MGSLWSRCRRDQHGGFQEADLDRRGHASRRRPPSAAAGPAVKVHSSNIDGQHVANGQ